MSKAQFELVMRKRNTEKIYIYNGAQDFRWQKYIYPELNRFALNIGINSQLTNFELTELKKTIKTDFSHFSIEELKDAFQCYIGLKK